MPIDEYGPVHTVFHGLSNITKAIINGKNVFFLQTHFRDVIQREHQAGRFYEQEELQIIKRYFRRGGVFCDIGTNVGNHTIYAGLFLEPSRIICFEPNPEIIPTLRANIFLNGLDGICELSHLGIGLSSALQDGMGLLYGRRNLGAARFKPGSGDLKVVPGDSVLQDELLDFVKIDVEGMELDVLRGLEQTVARSKPVIFIECMNRNVDEVMGLLGSWGYSKKDEWRRYEQNTNLLFQHDSVSGDS